MKRFPLFVSLACVMSLGCSDNQPTSLSRYKPNAMISDGAKAGNVDFFFYPPLVPNPVNNPNYNPADFDATQAPEVSICELALSKEPPFTAKVCGDEVAHFSMTGGLGGEKIGVDAAAQQYHVNWHTDLSTPALNPNNMYRIVVLLMPAPDNPVPLGFADVDVVSTGKDLRSVQTGEFIGLVNGRTLPIKFRIEKGIRGGNACVGETDCASQTIGSGGGTIITSQAKAGISIPPGALGANTTITIKKKIGTDPCMPADVPQILGICYSFTANPPLPGGKFKTSVVVAECVDVPADLISKELLLQLYRHHSPEVEGDQEFVEALPNAPADFLPCNESRIPPIEGLGMRGGWRGVVNRVASWLAPRPAFAAVIDLGVGGDAGGISDIGWGLPVKIEFVEGGTSAPAGSSPTPLPAVKMTDASCTSGGESGPECEVVGGATVHFRITGGSGSLDAEQDGVMEATVLSDPTTGIARVPAWRLGPGETTLEASGVGLDRATPDRHPSQPRLVVETTPPITFIATGTATGPLFGEVITPGAAGSPRSGISAMTIGLAQCGEGSTIGAPGTCTSTEGSASLVTDANGRFATQLAPGLWQIRPDPQSAEYPGITPIANTVAVPMVDSKNVGAQFTALMIDQQQSTISIQTGIGIYDGSVTGTSLQPLAQTVTAAVNGSVTEIYMPVWCSAGSNLTIALRGVGDNNAPNDVAFGESTVIPGGTIPQPATGHDTPLRRLVLTTPIGVDAGQRYAIVLGSTGSCALGAQGPLGNSYNGGDAWFWSSSSGRWVLISPISGESQRREDFPFKVLVQESKGPEGVTGRPRAARLRSRPSRLPLIKPARAT